MKAPVSREQQSGNESGKEDVHVEESDGRASVSLTRELAAEVDRYVAVKALGFDSRAAFVKEGIRALFLKYRELLRELQQRGPTT